MLIRISIKKARSGHCFCWRLYDFMNQPPLSVNYDSYSQAWKRKLSNKPESRPYQSREKNEHPNDYISATYGCISYGTLIQIREAFIPNLAQAEPLKPRPGWAMS